VLREDSSSSEIVQVLRQAGEGLAAFHDRGLLHRDFKPANVMIGMDGRRIDRVRVLDLGLARAAEPGAAAATQHEQSTDSPSRTHLAGTPAYMASRPSCSSWFADLNLRFHVETRG
jgi:eukaryotic-like serine/threonine-protein kinase